MAVELADAGANIIGVLAPLETQGSAVEQDVTALGRQFRGYRCDLSQRAGVCAASKGAIGSLVSAFTNE